VVLGGGVISGRLKKKVPSAPGGKTKIKKRGCASGGPWEDQKVVGGEDPHINKGGSAGDHPKGGSHPPGKEGKENVKTRTSK